jgi:ketosteroid isomerase-like protein
MLDGATVARLERHWLEGWNGEDVELIMEPYADDVVFSSPFSGSTIAGRAALTEYVDAALKRTPGIRYTLDETYVGTDAICILYTASLPNGTTKSGADTMRVDGSGQIVDWRCHYTRAST